MRRSSFTPLPPEPLIVVEEAEGSDDELSEQQATSMEMDIAAALEKHRFSIDDDEEDSSHLCPWRDPRDMRKRSLPTPACTSGITASQVRRLSERSAATARESAFLATLTSAPAPGRRHSVTISRVPPTIYPGCKGRRESIAAFPSGRRDSAAASFNLHLDIMDDIAEIKGARKARMKVYKTSSKEQVCEISTEDNNSPIQFRSPMSNDPQCSGSLRAPHEQGRRHSDSAGLVPQQPLTTKRKSSEQLSSSSSCANTELAKLLSSAQATNVMPPTQADLKPVPQTSLYVSEEEKKYRTNPRSNSFDVSMLSTSIPAQVHSKKSVPGLWIGKKSTVLDIDASCESDTESGETELKPEVESKVMWNKPTGSVVDALGSAIGAYLRRGEAPVTSPATSASAASPAQTETGGSEQSKQATKEGNRESSSICSTLKDLFVK